MYYFVEFAKSNLSIKELSETLYYIKSLSTISEKYSVLVLGTIR